MPDKVETIIVEAHNVLQVVDEMRRGRLVVLSAEMLRRGDAPPPMRAIDASSPEALAAWLINTLIDRDNYGVQLTVRRLARRRGSPRRAWGGNAGHAHPYRSVADDIEYFHDVWLSRPDDLSDAEIRRGSAQLDLVLVQGAAGRAWRHYAFAKQPTVQGPDLLALAAAQGLRLEMAVGLVAGGARTRGLQAAFVGAFRVDNPTTGVPAEAEEGFAVQVSSIARDPRATAVLGRLDELAVRSWPISEYMDAPGAVRRGQQISRRELLRYFRNYVGGAHLDVEKSLTATPEPAYVLIEELEQRVRVGDWDGLTYGLLSIGQAIGSSRDFLTLAAAIREDTAKQDSDA